MLSFPKSLVGNPFFLMSLDTRLPACRQARRGYDDFHGLLKNGRSLRLAILAAFPQELSTTLRALKAKKVSGSGPFPLYSAQYLSCEVVLNQTGIGVRNAESALGHTVREYSPDLVLSIGFGGALYAGAEIGDLIWASKVVLLDDGMAESIGLAESREAAGRIGAKITMREGTVLTLCKQIRKSEIGKELYGELPLPVCDMETFPVARAALASGLPFLAVRSITDRADEDIPSEFYNVSDGSGHYRLSRALTVLLCNPRLVPAGARLGRNSNIASRNLWHAVKCLIESFGG